MEHDMTLRFWECRCIVCQRMHWLVDSEQDRPMAELLQSCDNLLQRSE